MKLLFHPQIRGNERIIYEFTDTTIKATHKGVTDVFDFSDFTDGELQIYDNEGFEVLDSKLEEQPLRSAKIIDGVLYVELMMYIGFNASYEVRFPKWIDHTEYEPPESDEEPTEYEPPEIDEDDSERQGES